MLSHGKDRITPLVCHRSHPHHPFLYDSYSVEKGFHYMSLPTHGGVIRVPYGICGLPGLTSVSLLKQLPHPQFPENTWEGTQFWQGDCLLTQRLHMMGVESYCDLDVPFWHLGEYSVSLQFVNGKFQPTYNTGI